MALKFEVGAEDFAGMDDGMKGLYVQKGDKYSLAVDGLPASRDNDLAVALAELDRYKAKHGESEKHLKAEASKAEAARIEALKKSGDIVALEESWSKKLAEIESAKVSETNQYRDMISSMAAGATAVTIAAEVFGVHGEIMLPHVNKRLTTEINNGQAAVRVLGVDGKPSAMTTAELVQELRGNKKYAPFVVGTLASGDGGPGVQGKPEIQTISRREFEAKSADDRANFIRKGGKLVDK